MALFSHSRKGNIRDYYNIDERELGRFVCNCVFFKLSATGLFIIRFDNVFSACGILILQNVSAFAISRRI